ncbi:hypothetical protein KHA94_00115 [Bacillus sp. FJAT-49705]|uniref:Uncharacterized protein n=1 Tax=Cytobacillus citreus TaxID=2833586 RepID=A0ABS5NLD0_9BACI|nr:hypothetical protein [Cytobacillus citreus]MBS4188626.1 hypothetical protein [Cytobacillus citreus]
MANQWDRRSVVLYKKTDKSEEQIGLFRSMKEAIEWANSNKIMSIGWARKSLATNAYPTPKLTSKKFPYITQYRFEYAPKKGYPEELYTIPLRDTNYGHSESYDSSNHAGIPCELYKNNLKLGTFSSVGEATVFLEERIGGALGSGLYSLLKGWVPSESSQLYGYSMKRLDNLKF